MWYPSLYQDPKKRNPKVDFLVSTVLAMFWLAGAAAWANGLGGLKWSCDTSNWLDRVSVCTKTSNTHAHHQYLYPKVGDNLSPLGAVILTRQLMHRSRTARGPRAVSAGPPARCCSAS